jgi:hypothetical protein
MSFKDNWDDNKKPSYLNQLVTFKRKIFFITNGLWFAMGFALYNLLFGF